MPLDAVTLLFQYYYNSKASQWLYWDAEKSTYLPAPSQGSDDGVPVEAGASAPAEKTSEKEEKKEKEKSKVAKKIAKVVCLFRPLLMFVDLGHFVAWKCFAILL